MKYATFSDYGVLNGRYDSAIHGVNIPTGAVEISDELFLQTVSETDGVWIFIDGAVSKSPFPDLLPPTADELKAAALIKRDSLLAEANEATTGMADAFIAGLLDGADTAFFKKYAAYKLLINKITAQPGYPNTIDWPEPPSA